MTAVIADVYRDSIAHRLGLAPGDEILYINGVAPVDLIQFRWEWAGEEVSVDVKTQGGIRHFDIVKAYDEHPGLRFESPVFDGLRLCENRCVFCFVDQMPPGRRQSLYVKDDDYRLSFLQGSYITMTNLTGADIERIVRERLSPLYVSVHASDPELRRIMLGRRRSDDLLALMGSLSGRGIEFHCQIVVCPGYNDGDVLYQTVSDLGQISGVLSVAVVPVGLTAHREGLAALRPVSRAEARTLIKTWLVPTQERYLAEKGSRFVWLSDEYYILADCEIPADETYEGYMQIENGVGLVRSFLQDAQSADFPEKVQSGRCLYLAGGGSAIKALAPLWERLREIKGLSVYTIALSNRFFGASVDVSGLLTGECLIQGLTAYGIKPGSTVFLSGVMVRDKSDEFIDGMSISEVSEALGCDLVFLTTDGRVAMDTILAFIA